MPKGGLRINSGRKQKLSEKLEITKRVTKTENDFLDFIRLKNLNLEDIKKTLLIILVFCFFCMPCYSQTLQGGVEYTVDKARIVAFDNSPMNISKDDLKNYLRDPYYYSNIGFLKGSISEAVAVQKIVPFYDKNNKLMSYGVQYNNEPNKKYHYLPNGNLIKIDVCYNIGHYPYKAISYTRQGKLAAIHLAVSENESFLFDKNKKLIGHWINNQFYNEKGEKDGTRRL